MRRRGFTLVELLVVIGIIVLLIGLFSPMIARSYRAAERARVAADLNAISAGLEAYRQDFSAYPVPTENPAWTSSDAEHPNPPTGAQLLCQALIGPAPMTDPSPSDSKRQVQDGVDGPGFRVKRFPGANGKMNDGDDDLNSKAYPPYLEVGRFKIGDGVDESRNNNAPLYALTFVILDKFKKPILYYPAHGNPNITKPNGYVGLKANHSLYWVDDNPKASQSTTETGMTLEKMCFYLGDNSSTTPNGGIDNGEQPAFKGPYILWSTGPDEAYGPMAGDAGNPNQLDKDDVQRCDDITNFRN